MVLNQSDLLSTPPNSFGQIWRHLGLSQLGTERCWHLTGRSQGHCAESCMNSTAATAPNYQPRWRHSGLDAVLPEALMNRENVASPSMVLVIFQDERTNSHPTRHPTCILLTVGALQEGGRRVNPSSGEFTRGAFFYYLFIHQPTTQRLRKVSLKST